MTTSARHESWVSFALGSRVQTTGGKFEDTSLVNRTRTYDVSVHSPMRESPWLLRRIKYTLDPQQGDLLQNGGSSALLAPLPVGYPQGAYIRRQICFMYGIFINIDQCRSLIYITIYLFNYIWSLHILFF